MFAVDVGELDEPHAGVLRVRLQQRIEPSLDDGLSAPLHKLIARRRPQRLVISFSALTRCTNEDMGALLAIQRLHPKAPLFLVELPETIRTKVEGLGLHRLLQIRATTEEALYQAAEPSHAFNRV